VQTKDSFAEAKESRRTNIGSSRRKKEGMAVSRQKTGELLLWAAGEKRGAGRA